jgi:O-antigen/teichoic acid export membrane protein
LFGIYAIALVLSTVILAAMDRVHGSVLFPLYSQLARRNDPAAMSANIRRVRLRLLAISLPPMWFVAIFGRHIVEFLYDARYHDAGWMLQLLAVTTIITIVSITIRPVMLAHGHANRHLAYTAISSIVLLTCLLIGAFTGGVVGVLVGAAVGEIIGHVVLLGCVRRYSIWTPGLDFTALAISAAVIALGWGALQL